MKVVSSYSVKIKHYNRIFNDTLKIYRKALDYFIGVCLAEWDTLSTIEGNLNQQRYIEVQPPHSRVFRHELGGKKVTGGDNIGVATREKLFFFEQLFSLPIEFYLLMRYNKSVKRAQKR